MQIKLSEIERDVKEWMEAVDAYEKAFAAFMKDNTIPTGISFLFTGPERDKLDELRNHLSIYAPDYLVVMFPVFKAALELEDALDKHSITTEIEVEKEGKALTEAIEAFRDQEPK